LQKYPRPSTKSNFTRIFSKQSSWSIVRRPEVRPLLPVYLLLRLLAVYGCAPSNFLQPSKTMPCHVVCSNGSRHHGLLSARIVLRPPPRGTWHDPAQEPDCQRDRRREEKAGRRPIFHTILFNDADASCTAMFLTLCVDTMIGGWKDSRPGADSVGLAALPNQPRFDSEVFQCGTNCAKCGK